jgi:hypothetical protein
VIKNLTNSAKEFLFFMRPCVPVRSVSCHCAACTRWRSPWAESTGPRTWQDSWLSRRWRRIICCHRPVRLLCTKKKQAAEIAAVFRRWTPKLFVCYTCVMTARKQKQHRFTLSWTLKLFFYESGQYSLTLPSAACLDWLPPSSTRAVWPIDNTGDMRALDVKMEQHWPGEKWHVSSCFVKSCFFTK